MIEAGVRDLLSSTNVSGSMASSHSKYRDIIIPKQEGDQLVQAGDQLFARLLAERKP
jgi:fructose-1-phosphate kinase PfkB-like protein